MTKQTGKSGRTKEKLDYFECIIQDRYSENALNRDKYSPRQNIYNSSLEPKGLLHSITKITNSRYMRFANTGHLLLARELFSDLLCAITHMTRDKKVKEASLINQQLSSAGETGREVAACSASDFFVLEILLFIIAGDC